MSQKRNRVLRKYCCVYGCMNSSFTVPPLSFFTLPKDDERRNVWLRLIDRQDIITKHSYVCEVHFNKIDILPGRIRKTLKRNVVPSLHLPNSGNNVVVDTESENNVVETESDDNLVKTESDNNVVEIESDNNVVEIESDNNVVEIESDNNVVEIDSDNNVVETESDDNVVEVEDPLGESSLDAIHVMSCYSTAEKSPSRPRSPNRKSFKTVPDQDESAVKTEPDDTDNEKKELEAFDELCDTLLTEDMAQLVKTQAFLKFHNKENYNKDLMKFSLNLYSSSPGAYRMLQTTLNLPNPNSLYKHHAPLTTDLNAKTTSILKTKVESMKELDKHCILILDVISLEPALFYNEKEDKISGFHEIDGVQSIDPAKLILVAMTRGLLNDWKQPVAYALLSEYPNYDDLSTWLYKLTDNLFEIGYNVRAIISDMASILYRAAQKRSITMSRPFFIRNSRKIYYIFDVAGLIKLARNNFLHYDFHFNGQVAKFDHVLQFYNQDKEKSVKIAAKLTDAHVNPSNSEKDKLDLATELLSRSVATGISYYIDFNKIDETARGTVQFINMINNVFEFFYLNSCSLTDNYEYRMPYCGDTDKQQTIFLMETVATLKNMKAIHPKNGQNVTVIMKFIEGIQVTINAIMKLSEDLKSDGLKLNTRRFNKEAIENCFSHIKTKKLEPTSKRFIAAFQKSFFLNVTKPAKGNNHVELHEILTQSRHESLTPLAQYDLDRLAGSYEYNAEVARSDYNQLEIPEQYPLAYICGYILRKCAEKHKCQTLRSYIKPSEERINTLKDTECTYLKYMSYRVNTNSNLIAIPSDQFIGFIEKLEKIFRITFENKYTNYAIIATIYGNMKNMKMSTSPCPCFPWKYLKLLFIRMRIFLTIKQSNSALRSNDKQNFFSVPNICGSKTG